MGSKVYVGNLPFNVDEQQLRGLFEGHGGGKARKRNRLHLIMRRSKLRKVRKEAEKAGGVKR